MRLTEQAPRPAGTNEDMPKLLSIATVLLATIALTASPALAAPDPVKATADFQEALFTPVAGVLDFEETADGIKVAGEFKKGFASDAPSDYQLVVLDNADVVLDFTKDFQKVAEIEAAEVAAFEFVTKTKQKIADIRNEDVVVRQLVDVAAGIKVQAEIGRAKVQRTEVR
ncbi:hypothetical protein SAMN04488564_105167 [Lentzea waywayandensis]|uniref:Uncharacterized protein n=2 Tax=Lentzea waywayandensis TaxID=84724 RepID=A0A1I6ER53_9PSEU|nr:hypothetical protein SAMN04488564_105167 [Lentzea waywayandensis]